MKISQLEGGSLDWSVARAIGIEVGITSGECFAKNSFGVFAREFSPSTTWRQGGPLIERERIRIAQTKADGGWDAAIITLEHPFFMQEASTPLIAACRAIVAAKLGDEIEIPDEMLTGQPEGDA